MKLRTASGLATIALVALSPLASASRRAAHPRTPAPPKVGNLTYDFYPTSGGLRSVMSLGDMTRAQVVEGLKAHSVAMMRYQPDGIIPGTAAEREGRGAGVLVAVGSDDGITLLDARADRFVRPKGKLDPRVIPLERIKDALAISLAAGSLGLARKFEMTLGNLRLSAPPSMGGHFTLAFDAAFHDERGVYQAPVTFSARLHWTPRHGLGQLSVYPMEAGVKNRAGWLYPPSWND